MDWWETTDWQTLPPHASQWWGGSVLAKSIA